jgi:hypothetical protein
MYGLARNTNQFRKIVLCEFFYGTFYFKPILHFVFLIW